MSMSDETAAARPPGDSRVEMTEIVLPNDTNAQGNILGGRVMHLIDIAAAMSAMRHCRCSVNTVHVDKISFRHPIPLGHLAVLKAQVNHAGRTSMEVGVKVWSENPLTGERKHTSSAYLTFVALDSSRRPSPVPPLRLETDDDRRRFAAAEARREANLRLRKTEE
jgi:acyl-CoA hydrolase